MQYKVAWKIGGANGEGEPTTKELAQAWADYGNQKYGEGTHWIVPALPAIAFR